uniref:Uncharacterized protein n=1 Tax=Anguilla anguilla TaxID=7936 RepID=A0A0E9SFV6_ANGAN
MAGNRAYNVITVYNTLKLLAYIMRSTLITL